MNNIYVDEIYEDCADCEFKVITSCRGFYTNYKCPFKDGCLSFGKNHPARKCPLKPLTDLLAEERKRVVQEIRDLSKKETDFGFIDEKITLGKLFKILDQIEKEKHK